MNIMNILIGMKKEFLLPKHNLYSAEKAQTCLKWSPLTALCLENTINGVAFKKGETTMAQLGKN